MMSARLSVFLGAAGISLGIQLTGFAVAFALRTEKFFDLLGGVNYLTFAVFSVLFVQTDFPEEARFENDARKLASLVGFCASRSWLLAFLAWRAKNRSGDSRFEEVKNKFWPFFAFWL